MSYQRGFIPILVLLIVALLAGFVIYQKQTTSPAQKSITQLTPSDETVYTEQTSGERSRTSRSANWKTFTNNTYKYSIQYPSNWPEPSNYQGDWNEDTTLSNGISVRIIKWVGPQWKNLKEYFDELYNDTNNEKATIDKNLAVKRIEQSTPEKPGSVFYSVNIYTFKNDLVYVIRIMGRDKNEVDTNLSSFNQILSTFRFTQ